MGWRERHSRRSRNLRRIVNKPKKVALRKRRKTAKRGRLQRKAEREAAAGQRRPQRGGRTAG